MPISLCAVQGDHSAPAPESLAYSLTLPAALRSPAIARVATRTVLVAHGLGALVDPAEQAVGELVAERRCACSAVSCGAARATGDSVRHGSREGAGGGTRMWAVLPCGGASAWGHQASEPVMEAGEHFKG
ncbi:hypothetical protein [Streptomyces sp. NPDC020747]|uniref:hypothetical protein n=1 Tax=Streptomyces sp. NPDC020747 TaxID=3365086 RepID=UPI00378CEBB7